MKYGVLVYEELKNKFNIGDYIQSIAAKKFLPTVDEFVNRENSAAYNGDSLKLIMNGWFTHTRTNKWIPSKDINPLFISFHLNNDSIPFMLTDEGVAYLKSQEPIGCRDQFTVDVLTEKGIDAYFSGCLTLTLDRFNSSEERKGVYIVDPLYNYPTKEKVFHSIRTLIYNIRKGKIWGLGRDLMHMKKIFTKEFLSQAEYVTHVLPGNKYSYDEKFEIAEELLKKYASAKLVVTSRIHCALPCLAMGTPVLYVNGFDNIFDTCRFNGLVDLFNRIDINYKTGEFLTNFGHQGKIGVDIKIKNKTKHINLANRMEDICTDFIAE